MSLTTKYIACAVVIFVTIIGIDKVTSFPASLDEDEECTLSTGRSGICKRLKHCPSALAAVRSRSTNNPVRCGFVGFEEIVCCPKGDKGSSVSTDVRSKPNGNKSQQACKQYRDSDVQRVGFFILGGEEAKDGEFPHMAALGFVPAGETSLKWLCAGTLISDRYVLTAAHCMKDRLAGNPKMVRLGQNDINAVSDGSDYPVESVELHPRYKTKVVYDDIALIKLAAPVEFSQNIRPACLYIKNGNPETPLIATGWGATDSAGFTQSAKLLKTSVRAVARETCNSTYNAGSKFPRGVVTTMMCAGDQYGESDTCNGDSGGPLQILEESKSNVYSVVGVTSYGPSPCGGKRPSIYTRVSSYLNWIESVVWP